MEEARPNSGLFIRHALHTYIVHIAVMVLGAVMTVLTARLLGPGGRGTLSLLILIPVLAVTFGRWGVGHALIYYAPRETSASLLFNGFMLTVIIGLAVSGLTFAFVSWQKDFLFKDVPPSLLAWMSAMVLFFFIYDYMGSLFIALGQVHRRNLIVLLFPLGYLFFFTLAAVVMSRGVAGAVAAWSLSVVLSVAVSLGMALRSDTRWRLSLDGALIRKLLRYGTRSHPGTMLELLNYRADYLLVNLFAGPAAVGLYSVAVNMAEIMWKLPEAVSVVLLPNVARMSAEEARVFTPKTSRVVLFSVIGMALAILLFRHPIINILFGSAFRPSSGPLVILLPGFIAFAVWKVLAYGFLGQGRPLLYSLTSGLAFAVMIGLDLALVPRKGIEGAAWASTAAYLLSTFAVIMVYRKTSGGSLRELFVPRKSDWLSVKAVVLKRDLRRGREE